MASPRKPSTPQAFPVSNVRGCSEETQRTDSVDLGKSSRKVKLRSIKGPKDHLTTLPRKNHRYVTDSGKLILDNRYTQPRVAKAKPKPPHRKPSKPFKPSKSSKDGPEPKRRSFDQPENLETVDTSLEHP